MTPAQPAESRVEAVERVRKYINSQARFGGERISGSGDARLTFTDLRALLAELQRTKERCWSLCSGNEFHGGIIERSDLRRMRHDESRIRTRTASAGI